jgi:hypothetical protein
VKKPIRRLAGSVSLSPSLRPPFITRRYPWRDRRRMLEALGPALAAEVRWTESPASSTAGGEMAPILESTPNIYKSLHYLPVYEAALAAFRDRPIRMLEIGVARGGSLQMWRRYLHPESAIVGIDINPKTSQFDNPSERLHIRIGAQQDTDFLHSVLCEFGAFDVILDDGSHMTSHMVDTFRYLFPNGLASGGVYIVEDIGTNYQKPWRDSPMTFVEFTKWIIDAMQARCQGDDHWRQNFAHLSNPNHLMDFTVPLATTLIEKVEFYDSIAVFHRAKGRREVPRNVYQ